MLSEQYIQEILAGVLDAAGFTEEDDSSTLGERLIEIEALVESLFIDAGWEIPNFDKEQG